MDKFTNYFGIDISKDVFDVCDTKDDHHKFENNVSGFEALEKVMTKEDHLVMEATGSYHQQLAQYFYNKGYSVSVVNPLVIRRFIQMRLKHNKTDKADASMIRLYAQQEQPELWRPKIAYREECMELEGVIRLLLKQRTALKNKLHSLISKGSESKIAIRSIKSQISRLTKEVETLEGEMEEKVKQHDGEMLTLLTSIPGIGKKTALFLIVITNGLENFSNSKQVSAYLGLAPTERVSGSSVRGRSRITKSGNATIRNLLFMCAFTACTHNKGCKQLYDRIVNKGKSKKLALIAVTNKLLKQAFGIVKSGLPYDANFRSVRPILA